LSRFGPEPAVGEHWAYRARAQDDLVEVAVIRLGIKTPARVLVRWLDDAFEGQQDWVPPARLKALWTDVVTFRAREQRWDEVTAPSEQYSETITSAVRSVFDLLVDGEVASLGYNATSGVLHVRDAAALAALAGLGPGVLRDATSFEEDGELISPMTVSLLVAQRLAARNPHPILQYIEREEAEARRDAIYGKVYPGRGRGKDWDVSPEICRQVDEEHGQPVRAVLRQWCGTEEVDVRAEISAARAEARRLAELAAAALDALRAAGHVRTANRLERERGGLPPIADERV
jgi:hypothetical protein